MTADDSCLGVPPAVMLDTSDSLLEGPTFDGLRQNEKLWEWYE